MSQTVCPGTNHDYRALPGDRYAKEPAAPEFRSAAKLWYHMLFCSHCGHTIEVVAEDRRTEVKEEVEGKVKLTSPFAH